VHSKGTGETSGGAKGGYGKAIDVPVIAFALSLALPVERVMKDTDPLLDCLCPTGARCCPTTCCPTRLNILTPPLLETFNNLST